MTSTGLLRLVSVSRRFDARLALRDVSLQLEVGNQTAIVGASGSGKSTLARLATGLDRPTSGSVEFEGRDLRTLDARARKAFCRRVQIVFQDAGRAFDPKWTAATSLRAVLELHGLEAGGPRVEELLARVGLEAELGARRPHELSGGQKQRLALARALALNPELLILDEPLSALDMVAARELLDLLCGLAARGLGLVLISHDLNAVRALARRIVILEAGRVVEDDEAAVLLSSPRHPHARSLLDAAVAWTVPRPERG